MGLLTDKCGPWRCNLPDPRKAPRKMQYVCLLCGSHYQLRKRFRPRWSLTHLGKYVDLPSNPVDEHKWIRRACSAEAAFAVVWNARNNFIGRDLFPGPGSRWLSRSSKPDAIDILREWDRALAEGMELIDKQETAYTPIHDEHQKDEDQ